MTTKAVTTCDFCGNQSDHPAGDGWGYLWQPGDAEAVADRRDVCVRCIGNLRGWGVTRDIPRSA